MNIAILVVGELRQVDLVKNHYDGCDVFVHTDEKWGKPFDAKYQYFTSNQQKFVNETFTKDWGHRENFHRVVQWLRYQELLRNDLSNYDVIVKTRTDLDLNIDSIYDFLKDKEIKENTLYVKKDFMWYGTYDTIVETDFFNYIMFYVSKPPYYFLPLNYDVVLDCDLDSMEFTWLNWDKIIDFNGDIKKQILENREWLYKNNSNYIKFNKDDNFHSEFKINWSFCSEKFFLHFLLTKNIIMKNIGFKMKLRSKPLGGEC